MSYRVEKGKNGGQEFVWDGVEKGIAPSPLFGNANIQNANISTQTGEAMASYARTNEAQIDIQGGTLTPDGATLFNAPAALKAGVWINVTASTVSGISVSSSPTTIDVDYLAVAGGGGGGGADSPGSNEGASGGGGGGGEVDEDTVTLAVGDYAITVGAGGNAGSSSATAGSNGSNTTIGALVTVIGGGGGGSSEDASDNGLNGSSGGGGGATMAGSGAGNVGTGGTGSAGFDGGDGFITTGQGGGGGGAGAIGATAVSASGGDGGDGVTSSITGTSVYYGGGGGGGAAGNGVPGSQTPGDGGQGGGADGGADNDGQAGTANTGGGGGGAGATDSANRTGGAGGSGIVIISYPTSAMLAFGGTKTIVGSNTVHTFTESGTFRVVLIAPENLYYVSYEDTNGDIKLSAMYDPYSEHAITHGTTGSITFNIVGVPGSGIAKAVEKYTDEDSTEYRYYILDNNGYTWVYDTAVYAYSLANWGVGVRWMMTDPIDYSDLGLTGMAILNGNLMTISTSYIYTKPTVDLGILYRFVDNVALNDPFPTHKNFAIVGSQGKMYYCDGNYIGEMFPTTSLVTSIANIQSYCKYDALTQTRAEIDFIIGGSLPYSPDGTRIPAVFFTDQYGTRPTAIDEEQVYYIDYDPSLKTFTVYDALTGGSIVDIDTGATGNQYFNTFYPKGPYAGVDGSTTLVQWTGQRVNLPFYETAQCLLEIGNIVLIGCDGSILYPWDQVTALPSDVIALPEANVQSMVNVNNMAYVFAGFKGNVYISNGSIASLAFKVPDYCAGVPGTPLTYIEPYFTWGDSSYIRGRVYFSILDQTATKAGNCGGIWSFIPAQNIDPTQDVGLSLRQENQNSYGTYSGVATIILPQENQRNAVSPQYWTAWQSSYSVSVSTFGIDNTATTPVTTFVVETDLLPTGTILDKKTFAQIEYKVSTPLQSGDAVQLYYRLNGTGAWTSCGTVIEETANRLSGYFEVNFQKTQWTQIRAVCTTGGTTASSFNRLVQIRLR